MISECRKHGFRLDVLTFARDRVGGDSSINIGKKVDKGTVYIEGISPP